MLTRREFEQLSIILNNVASIEHMNQSWISLTGVSSILETYVECTEDTIEPAVDSSNVGGDNIPPPAIDIPSMGNVVPTVGHLKQRGWLKRVLRFLRKTILS